MPSMDWERFKIVAFDSSSGIRVGWAGSRRDGPGEMKPEKDASLN